jgi:hypothetical protein
MIDDSLINELIMSKPDNVRILTYQMITRISKLAQVAHTTDLPDIQLIACLNSYRLLQHFHSFCTDTWFCWKPPGKLTGTVPSIFFVSSFQILAHPRILRSFQRTSIGYHIKYEMVTCMILFLLTSTQAQSDHYPNMHFECLDEVDPICLFRFILTFPEIDELFRLSIILACNGLAFCPNWQTAFASLKFTSLMPILQTMLRLPTEPQLALIDSPAPGAFHEIVAFFYQTLLRHDESLDWLPQSRPFLVGLLFPIQVFNERGSVSYFHSLAFSALVLITSDPQLCTALNEPFGAAFPCRQSVHRGTHADLLMEIITNTVVADFARASPLLPAVSCVFHNISSYIQSFSFFTCNRIFQFLQLLTTSKDRLAPQVIQIVIDGFNQIIAEQFDTNTAMLMLIVKHMATFNLAKKRGVNIRHITAFTKCFKTRARASSLGKMGQDDAERLLREIRPAMFMGEYERPGPRGHVFGGEMAELWPDWMRTLVMRGGAFKTLQS